MLSCIQNELDLSRECDAYFFERAHNGNLVLLVPHLRIAYVEVRKAASETIRGSLSHFFNTTTRTCGDGFKDASRCGLILYRRPYCTHQCVTPEMARSYFWFSFVRDPVERYYSQLAQVFGKFDTRQVTYRLLSEMLRQRESASSRGTECHPLSENYHLVSQTVQLKLRLRPPPTAGPPPSAPPPPAAMLPLHFLGRVERFNDDVATMMHRALKFHKAAANDEASTHLQNAIARLPEMIGWMNADENLIHHGNRTIQMKQHVLRLRNATLDALVAAAFKSDMACFALT